MRSNTNPKKMVTFYLTQEQITKLKKIAEEQDVSYAHLIRLAVKKFIEEQGK